jgi:hypothetical protein
MAAAILIAGLIAALAGGVAALAAGFGVAALAVYGGCGLLSGLVVAVLAARTRDHADAAPGFVRRD